MCTHTHTHTQSGRLIGNARRGPAEIELNQGDDKNGFISRGDMADIVAAIAVSKDAARYVCVCMYVCMHVCMYASWRYGGYRGGHCCEQGCC